MRVEELAPFFVGRVVGIWHVRKQKVEQRVLVCVGKFSIRIAPFAVIFVEAAVNFAADHRVVTERHAAALTEKLARRSEQRVDGYIEFL